MEAGHPGYFDDQEYEVDHVINLIVKAIIMKINICSSLCEEETDDEEPIPQGIVEGAQVTSLLSL